MDPDIAVAQDGLRHRVIDGLGALLSRVLRYDVGDVSEATRLRDELGMTSASTMELMLELEDRLGIEVDVDDLDEADVESIGTLVSYVVAHARPVG